MPKIKDLGISVLPATMRPPEIGPGGGYLAQCAMLTCSNRGCGTPSGQCEPHSGEVQPPHCHEHTAKPEGEPSAPVECAASHTPEKNYDARGFSAEAAAQLREQLEDHLRNELVN